MYRRSEHSTQKETPYESAARIIKEEFDSLSLVPHASFVHKTRFSRLSTEELDKITHLTLQHAKNRFTRKKLRAIAWGILIYISAIQILIAIADNSAPLINHNPHFLLSLGVEIAVAILTIYSMWPNAKEERVIKNIQKTKIFIRDKIFSDLEDIKVEKAAFSQFKTP